MFSNNTNFALSLPGMVFLFLSIGSPSCLLAAPTIINFSTAPQNSFLDPGYYTPSGLTLGQSHFVTSLLQGSPALVANRTEVETLPITGTFSLGALDLGLEIAPFFQGAASYRLVAFDSDSLSVGDRTIRIVQDERDPLSSIFGYVPLTLGPFNRPATSFRLTSVFESGFGQLPVIDYGVRTISFTPVPELESGLIALFALVALFLRPNQ
jgi:hypothetical protein